MALKSIRMCLVPVMTNFIHIYVVLSLDKPIVLHRLVYMHSSIQTSSNNYGFQIKFKFPDRYLE